jgi:hypothetical protein
VLERLPIDEPAKRTRVLGHAAPEQAANLVEQAALELLINPPRHARRDGRGRHPQPDGEHVHVGDG